MSTTTIAPPSGAPTPPPSGGPPAWHTLDPDAALAAQAVDSSTGLSAAEVQNRVKQFGPNAFTQEKKESTAQRWLRQYQDPMQIVLVVAGLVTIIALRQWSTGLVLLGLTLLNAVMGLHQEGKAEASVSALQKMLIVKTRVRRAGLWPEQLPLPKSCRAMAPARLHSPRPAIGCRPMAAC
jgi:Ca2+-transporting ATPase